MYLKLSAQAIRDSEQDQAQHKGCGSKIAYSTAAEARQAAAKITHCKGGSHDHYRCHYHPDHWHTTLRRRKDGRGMGADTDPHDKGTAVGLTARSKRDRGRRKKYAKHVTNRDWSAVATAVDVV
jgi:hypothetical protein